MLLNPGTVLRGRYEIVEKIGSGGMAVVYVLVPFVLSNVAVLLLFTALRGGRGRYGLLVTALAAGLLAAVPGLASGGEAYGTARLWAWTAALFAGTGLYLWQLKVMYGKIRRGETICWN